MIEIEVVVSILLICLIALGINQYYIVKALRALDELEQLLEERK